MSEALYQTRLYWDGRRGIAKVDGVSIELRRCPLPMPTMEVDYAPATRSSQIRESAQGWREMTAAERKACDAVLDQLLAFRAALENK